MGFVIGQDVTPFFFFIFLTNNLLKALFPRFGQEVAPSIVNRCLACFALVFFTLFWADFCGFCD